MTIENLSIETRSDPMHGFDTLKPMTPPQKPNELKAFRELNRKTQYQEEAKFFMQGYIVEYVNEKWNVERYNRDSYLWCKHLLTIVSNTDTFTRHKIKTTMQAFASTIKRTIDPFRALRIKIDYLPDEPQADMDWEE